MDDRFVLVTVHDLYGRRMAVRQDKLADTSRTVLQIYHPRTRQPFSRELGDKDGASFLHRSNICEHDPKSFVTVSVPGDTWRECPVCRWWNLITGNISGSK